MVSAEDCQHSLRFRIGRCSTFLCVSSFALDSRQMWNLNLCGGKQKFKKCYFSIGFKNQGLVSKNQESSFENKLCHLI